MHAHLGENALTSNQAVQPNNNLLSTFIQSVRFHLGNHPFSLSNFIQESKPTRVTQQVKKIPVMDFSISFAQSHLTTLSEGILARETSWFGLGLDIQKQ